MAMGSSRRDTGKEQFWREKIARQPGSGLSIRAYCRRNRLGEATFYFWRRELLRRGVSGEFGPAFVPVRLTNDSGPQATPPALAPADEVRRARRAGRQVGQHVELADQDSQADTRAGGCIEIVLSSGQCVRVHGPADRQSLAEVLAALRLDEASAPRPVEAEGRRC